MDCEEAAEMLAGLFDDDADTVEENPCGHLEACPECRDIFSNLLLLRAFERIARSEWDDRRRAFWG